MLRPGRGRTTTPSDTHNSWSDPPDLARLTPRPGTYRIECRPAAKTEAFSVTCSKCKTAMKQTRGIHHNKRKFTCPRCGAVRMKRHRER